MIIYYSELLRVGMSACLMNIRSQSSIKTVTQPPSKVVPVTPTQTWLHSKLWTTSVPMPRLEVSPNEHYHICHLVPSFIDNFQARSASYRPVTDGYSSSKDFIFATKHFCFFFFFTNWMRQIRSINSILNGQLRLNFNSHIFILQVT